MESIGPLSGLSRRPGPAGERQEARDAITVEGLCREYSAKMQRGLILGRKGKAKKPSTILTDQGRIERHIIPLLGSKLAKEVTQSDVARFRDAVAEGRTAADVKTKTRGRAHRGRRRWGC